MVEATVAETAAVAATAAVLCLTEAGGHGGPPCRQGKAPPRMRMLSET
jgi:hypothetical protein